MARSIVGLFQERAAAERAIENLKAAGFDPSRIGVVTRDRQDAQDIADEYGTRSTEGAVAGGLIGGTAGALLAATGALVIPGIGPFITGGILASLVGGAAGWLVGGLAGLGVPREEAEYYERRVHEGGTLVTVDAQGRDAEARRILISDGAEDLQDRGFGGGYDDARAGGAGVQQAASAAASATSATTTDTADVRVPLMEEELVASKRREEIGRVHVHKDVVEEQESVPVTLQREQVIVERAPVTGQVDAADMTDAFRAADIDVPVMGEEAVVAKRAREVEEVRLHKDAVTNDEQVTDTIRRERLTVQGADEAIGADQDAVDRA